VRTAQSHYGPRLLARQAAEEAQRSEVGRYLLDMSALSPQRKSAGAGRDPLVVFRAPVDLIDAIRRTARAERLTLSELVRSAMRERVGLQPPTNEAPRHEKPRPNPIKLPPDPTSDHERDSAAYITLGDQIAAEARIDETRRRLVEAFPDQCQRGPSGDHPPVSIATLKAAAKTPAQLEATDGNG